MSSVFGGEISALIKTICQGLLEDLDIQFVNPESLSVRHQRNCCFTNTSQNNQLIIKLLKQKIYIYQFSYISNSTFLWTQLTILQSVLKYSWVFHAPFTEVLFFTTMELVMIAFVLQFKGQDHVPHGISSHSCEFPLQVQSNCNKTMVTTDKKLEEALPDRIYQILHKSIIPNNGRGI